MLDSMSGLQQWSVIVLYGAVCLLYTVVGRFTLRQVARNAALQLGRDAEPTASEMSSAWLFSANYWVMLAPVLCLLGAIRR